MHAAISNPVHFCTKKNRGIITFIFQGRIFFVELWQEEGLQPVQMELNETRLYITVI